MSFRLVSGALLVSALVSASACATSHTAPDGAVPADGARRTDSDPPPPPPPPPPPLDGGLLCGTIGCAPSEECCDTCGGPPFFCAPAVEGCPILMCPDRVVRSCEDARAFGFPGAPCEGAWGCASGDGCCSERIHCDAGSLVMERDCIPDCGMESGAYVIDTLEIGQADPFGDPNIVPGMNLDGVVSDGTDPRGCLHVDFTSPLPDNERGVDNQLGPIMSAVGSSLDLDFGEAIASGRLLILLVASLRPGDTRQIDLHLGATADGRPPQLDSRGTLRSGQTFRLLRPLGTLTGDAGADRFRTEIGGPVAFPVHPRSPTPIALSPAQLYGDFAPFDRIMRGVLGGAYSVADLVSVIVAIDPDTIPEALARSVLNAQADIEPGFTGECTRVSAAFTFTAVEARLSP